MSGITSETISLPIEQSFTKENRANLCLGERDIRNLLFPILFTPDFSPYQKLDIKPRESGNVRAYQNTSYFSSCRRDLTFALQKEKGKRVC